MTGRQQVRRRTRGGWGPDAAKLVVALALIGFGLAVWAALAVGSMWAGMPVNLNPTAALLELASGQRRWPWQSTVIAAGFGLVAMAAAVTVTARRWHGRQEIDTAARTMLPPRKLTVARPHDNAQAAARLLADAPREVQAMKGPPLGPTVIGGTWLHVPAELGVFFAAGTRTGKTMAWAIPALLGAWGPAVATSNRPDLYRHTVLGRERRGEVWLSDLQGVTGTVVCGFWVDMLEQIETLAAARKLASFFVSASKERDAKVDAYFDGGAQELLAGYLYAAALAGGDLLHVVEWLSRDQDATPALLLRRFGKYRAAQRIIDAQSLYARQRDGLYDMARRFLNVLSDDVYAQMVTPPNRRSFSVYENHKGDITVEVTELPVTHHLPKFVPEEFVRSNDTLYALSMEGSDGATPLMTALVGQLLEAALKSARSRVDGRLPVPLLGVLDEAANCCRIAELPNYYTYAGGSGVVLLTFLQVLEQGEELWGANGLKTIRAQSIEVYGGGIGDPDYLTQWSQMADDHEVADWSQSHGPGGANHTLTWRSEPNLTVAALAALPKTRALVRLPGHPPVLIRKVPWFHTEHADLISQSLSRFATPSDPEPLVIDAEPEEAEPENEGYEL